MTAYVSREKPGHLVNQLKFKYAHLAMTLADELDLRPLRGIAYFEVMQKAKNAVVARITPGSPSTISPAPREVTAKALSGAGGISSL